MWPFWSFPSLKLGCWLLGLFGGIPQCQYLHLSGQDVRQGSLHNCCWVYFVFLPCFHHQYQHEWLSISTSIWRPPGFPLPVPPAPSLTHYCWQSLYLAAASIWSISLDHCILPAPSCKMPVWRKKRDNFGPQNHFLTFGRSCISIVFKDISISLHWTERV